MIEFEALGNAAADQGITLVLENGPTLRHGSHSVGNRWNASTIPPSSIRRNIDHSRQAGEIEAITGPTLNSRIRYVRTATPGVHEAMIRLKGIGYQGWVEYSGSADRSEEFLKAARL